MDTWDFAIRHCYNCKICCCGAESFVCRAVTASLVRAKPRALKYVSARMTVAQDVLFSSDVPIDPLIDVQSGDPPIIPVDLFQEPTFYHTTRISFLFYYPVCPSTSHRHCLQNMMICSCCNP
ncbi:hypothetical protein ADUPG1_007771 [Aduncisulcus paluster]|uniref:Uncharacterized protein n=1 Tax=Aduncisulcus paluster TaxID=2918883 RepID=A0ABQ5KPF8_9EUKA|nr:hypothetical protein ADUPG1_007771 [Aduncisulcus paluster]